MKKLISIVAILTIVCCILAGCEHNEIQHDVDEGAQSAFVMVERGKSYVIVYHEDTKVMYAISNGSYNYGTFTLLVDSDGTPMLWEG